MAAQMDELREQLARTPAEVVVANHAFGLFELAALHLSLQPPQLDQARLAIDALAALVEGLGGRLGDAAAAAVGRPGPAPDGLRADPAPSAATRGPAGRSARTDAGCGQRRRTGIRRLRLRDEARAPDQRRAP